MPPLLSETSPVVLSALVLLGALVLLQTLRLWWARARPRWRIDKHRRQGAHGEVLAERLLTEQGYRVVARQISTRYALLVDGEPQEFALRADFLVERRGRRYVAEAKLGEHAGRLDTSATRRQVLEYCLAFDVPGVLLVDARRRTITLVQLPRESARPSSLTPWVLVLLLVAALGLALR